jgi:hypothetical protein
MSTSYHIYGNGGSGPVNYGSILATTAALTWTSGALAFPNTWKFGVRAFDTVSSLEESNIDALVEVTLSGAGVDITGMPDPPLALSAHASGAGRIVVDWHHVLLDVTRKPTGFHVYQGTGGTPSYTTPVATVPWGSGINFYTRAISGLTGGTAYTFGVRAYNATGEESNATTATATASTAATATVTSLVGSAIP